MESELPPDAVIPGFHESDKPAANYMQDMRKGFIRKVYGILSLELMVTVAICCLCMFSEGVRTFTASYALAIQLITFIPMFVMLIVLFYVKDDYPLNLFCLSIFVLLMSWGVGAVCAIYYENGAGNIVLMAFALTCILFVTLSIFTLQSKIDFSFLGMGLFACLWILIFWGFINAIFGFRTSFLYALFGAIVFCLFIIYDTYRLANKYSVDDYIIASIELYLDFINLFLYLLQLLTKRN